ncbi:hypothetical protein [Frankia sp. Cj3]|uniref:hypothetical protein n=1 Tax=Frankia sp. Cj3 TaxID=2880976 RepID=UPI001EF5F566|nr:hypothetical protein [Frankia sp. Cj3]
MRLRPRHALTGTTSANAPGGLGWAGMPGNVMGLGNAMGLDAMGLDAMGSGAMGSGAMGSGAMGSGAVGPRRARSAPSPAGRR